MALVFNRKAVKSKLTVTILWSASSFCVAKYSERYMHQLEILQLPNITEKVKEQNLFSTTAYMLITVK